MAVEEALTTLLAGVASGRRYWGRAENISVSDGPFLVLNRVSAPRDYTLAGPSGYVASRFQIDAYGETYIATKTAARAVVAALSGHSGTTSGTRIMGIFVDSERDAEGEGTITGQTAAATYPFRTTIDLFVHHDE